MKAVIAGVVGMWFASASISEILIFSDRQELQDLIPGLGTTVGFEGLAPPGGVVQAPPLFDFTVESGTGPGLAWGVSAALPAPSAVLFQFNAGDLLIITLPSPVSTIGFQISCVNFFDVLSSGDAFVRAYDLADNELLDVTIGTAPIASMSTFFGVVDGEVRISRLEIGAAPGFPGYVALDDVFYYGVPAPGGGVCAIAALAAAGRRRRVNRPPTC